MICPECKGGDGLEFCRMCNGDGVVTETDFENWMIDLAQAGDGDETQVV